MCISCTSTKLVQVKLVVVSQKHVIVGNQAKGYKPIQNKWCYMYLILKETSVMVQELYFKDTTQ